MRRTLIPPPSIDYISPWGIPHDDLDDHQIRINTHRKQILHTYNNLKKKSSIHPSTNTILPSNQPSILLIKHSTHTAKKSSKQLKDTTFINRCKNKREGASSAIKNIINLNHTFQIQYSQPKRYNFEGRKLTISKQLKKKQLKIKTNNSKESQKYIRQVYGRYMVNKQKEDQLIKLLNIKVNQTKIRKTEQSLDEKFRNTNGFTSKAYKSFHNSKRRLKTANAEYL